MLCIVGLDNKLNRSLIIILTNKRTHLHQKVDAPSMPVPELRRQPSQIWQNPAYLIFQVKNNSLYKSERVTDTYQNF